jgi:hypothetical protein
VIPSVGADPSVIVDSGSGPSVTVDVGSSGIVVVTLTAGVTVTPGAPNSSSIEICDMTLSGTSDPQLILRENPQSAFAPIMQEDVSVTKLIHLPPGLNTLTAIYSAGGAGSCTWSDREILVAPY